MKDIKDQIQDLKDYLCTIAYIRGIIWEISDEINDLKQTMDSLDNTTRFIFSGYFYDLCTDIHRTEDFLERRYKAVECELKALEQTLLDDASDNESTEINPEYVKEFEEMLSDGDIPF